MAVIKKTFENNYRYFSYFPQETGGYLIEQQLTVDEVPVIVDKCINFVATHGKMGGMEQGREGWIEGKEG